MANSATLTFGYTNTDFTRKYTFNNLSAEDCANLKAKVLSLNESISGGLSAAAGLSTTSTPPKASDTSTVSPPRNTKRRPSPTFRSAKEVKRNGR